MSFHANDAKSASCSLVSRPKRVVFLVDAKNVSNSDINEIIKYSLNCWGGRYFAIIPCTEHEIEQNWWWMLKQMDPDYVYSFVPLDDSLVSKINRLILPLRTIVVPSDVRSKNDGVIRVTGHEIRALNTYDIPQYLGVRREYGIEPKFYIIEGDRLAEKNSAFVLRNFGVLDKSTTSRIKLHGISHQTIYEPITRPIEYFEKFYKPDYLERSYYPIDLCSVLSYRPGWTQSPRKAGGFQLVIGDSPWDAIYAWNFGLQHHLDCGREWLWLPASTLEDIALLESIGKWLRLAFRGHNGQRYGSVVSSSISAHDLNMLAEQIGVAANIDFKVLELAAGEFPFTDYVEDSNHRYSYLYPAEYGTMWSSDRIPALEGMATIDVARPSFQTTEDESVGWMVDAYIQYRPERYWHFNEGRVTPNWILPKRKGISELFLKGPFHRAHRIVSYGFPSTEVRGSSRRLTVEIPSDKSVIFACCFGHAPGEKSPKLSEKTKRFVEFETSDKGKYVSGVLQLFGTLFHAGQFFNDPFWRAAAYKLAGRTESDWTEQEKIQRAENLLNHALREVKEPLVHGSLEMKKVVERIADGLSFKDKDETTFTLDQFKGYFSELRRAFQSKENSENSKGDYWENRRKFDRTMQNELSSFLRKKLILQGVTLRCPLCYTTRWHSLAQLNAQIQCEGCQSFFPFPVNPDWSFRLNGLIGNALRQHGIPSVIQALQHFESKNALDGMLLYLPCQDLYEPPETDREGQDHSFVSKNGVSYENSGRVFTDLDLMMLKHGKFIIGEVKSNPKGFKTSDFEKLKTVALEILPDEVLIVATGASWPNDIDGKIRNFTAHLAEAKIKVTPLLLEWKKG